MSADVQLIRLRILNALSCPPSVMTLETTIASYMLSLGSARPVRLGLEGISELLGNPGQRRYAQRALNNSQEWQKRANVRLCRVTRGKRNERRVTEFDECNLNDAALLVAHKLSEDTRQIPTLSKIDELVPLALALLREPLAEVKPAKTKSSRLALPKTETEAAEACESPNTIKAVDLARRRFRMMPLEGKRPLIWKYNQAATCSEGVILAWAGRFRNPNWGILCGVPLPGGGVLSVVDVDDHGGNFGNGYQTLNQRESELGRLPQTYTVTTSGGGRHFYFQSSKPIPTTHDLIGPGLDCKSAGGFVVAVAHGYDVVHDLPIAQLPIEWERALAVVHQPKKRIAEGDRHDYLRGVAYAMARDGKPADEILRKLRQRLEFNCDKQGRLIPDGELQQLAVSAAAKVSRANYMLDLISA